MSSKPRPLHTINAMLVLAEYWVVRYHCLVKRGPEKPNMGPIGDDIMGFSNFFVMSGFVVMYRHEKTDFSSWESKREFLVSRVRLVYPVFLLNIMFEIPSRILANHSCWVYYFCPALQLIMLDGWAGCGWLFQLHGTAWFLSCIIWLWLAFPFVRDCIVERLFGQQWLWCKMAINMVWAMMFPSCALGSSWLVVVQRWLYTMKVQNA